MRVLPLLLALVAAAALVGVLALPVAIVDVADEGETTRTTWSFFDVQDGQGHPVGAAYLLTAAIVFVVGAIAFWIGDMAMARRAGPWILTAGGLTAAAGIGMSLHANLLWAGRIVPTLLHMLLGTDGPSPELLAAGYDAADQPAAIYPVSGLVVAALAALAFWLLTRAWAAHVDDRRDLKTMARRHAKWGFAAIAVLATAAFVPWNAMELDDNTTPADGQAQDTDIFILSAYDVLRGRSDSYTLAEETGENALIHFEWLSMLLGAVFVGLVIAIALAPLAVTGTMMASRGEAVWGRLMENIAFTGIGIFGYAAIVGVLGAFVLVDASDIFDGILIVAPLLVTAVAGWALAPTGRVVRELVREDSELVADDFPEPIVYE